MKWLYRFAREWLFPRALLCPMLSCVVINWRITLMNRSSCRVLLLSLLFALIAALPSYAASKDPGIGRMTKAERAYLLSELKSSEKAMLQTIKGLTPAQWTYKPSPDSWSIAQCAEHLILAEDLIFGEAQKTLNTPAVARLDIATPTGDRQVVAQLEDRSKKAKAPAILQPAGKFPTPQSAAEEFEIRRGKTISYVKSTKDALRAHVGDGPSQSTRDVYQFLLEMAAHTVRHTAQMREVKSTPGYPRS